MSVNQMALPLQLPQSGPVKTTEQRQAFERMRADAATQGLDIKAVSGFRDRKLQEELSSDQVAEQGSPGAAAKISAPAGHSEHHTGLAVDVGNNANPYLV